jgi:capsular exopolysaccharide synthesis family protein
MRRLEFKVNAAEREPRMLPAPLRSFDDDGGSQSHVPHLRDYALALYKRRRTGLAAFAIVVGAMVAYTFTATPIYEARARILMDAERQNIVDFKEIVAPDDARGDYYQTQYNLLESRSLARKTITALNLWRHPQFAGDGDEAGRFSPRALYATLRGALAQAGGNAPVHEDETQAESKVIDRFLEHLTVAPLRTSRLTDIRFTSPDAVLATKIANEHAHAFIEQNLEFKFTASKEASAWLVDQLQQQRKQVETAESALQAYRESNEAISFEDRENIVVQKLTDLNGAVTRAKTERIEKESRYEQLMAMRSRNAPLDTFPTILANPFIQQQKTEIAGLQRQQAELGRRLGDLHPDMVKLHATIEGAQEKLETEISKVVESVKNEFLGAQAQERALLGALNAQKLEALSMNRKAIEYGVLQRDVESSRQVYNSLLQRTKETGVSTELKTNNIRVVDAAEVPRSPISPRHMVDVFGGVLCGAALGIFLVFFFEYIDNRLKTPDAVAEALGLTALAILPRVSGGDEPLVTASESAGFVEAIRCLRTNVLFSQAQEQGARTVVVTSTGPEEGKSVTAANLAISLSEAGLRVVLIDADLRRPRVHEIMGTVQEPGLSNVLVGTATPSQALRPTKVGTLRVMGAGRIPPNPAELLGSDQFKRFLASLNGFFDWVIIDAPPVLPVTDAVIMSQSVTGVLFVVDADETNRYRARHALSRLRRVRAPLLGAVLNGADFSSNSAYYSDYYSADYQRYYVAGAPAENAS